MIVWNVANRWFASKAEAEQLRRELKLRPACTRRAEVHDRQQLVALIDRFVMLPPLPAPPAKADPRQLSMFDGAADEQRTLKAISLAGTSPESVTKSAPETEAHWYGKVGLHPDDGSRYDPETGELIP